MSFVANNPPWGQVDSLEIMPFGKQKGAKLEEVETGMLRWWLKKMDSDGLRTEYRQAVLDVLAARGDRPPAPPRSGPPVGVASARLFLAAEFRSVLKAWYGRLSLRFHPDKGGTSEQMIVVAEAYRTLMAELEKWEGMR